MRRGAQQLPNVVSAETRVLLVDGGSPRTVQHGLESLARAHDYGLLRCDHLLTPNRARNLAIANVDTEFVLFLDYETRLPAGAVERLESCAREHGAAIVGPVYLQEARGTTTVHMAGGEAHIAGPAGNRRFVDRHLGVGQSAPHHEQLGQTEQVEFHCMLVRRDLFDRLGLLDE